VKRGHEAAALRGTPGGGGLRPFGYEPDRMTVRECEADVIREAMERLLCGEPLRRVVIDFEAREIPTARGGRWNGTTLRACLLRPRIAGLREHKGQIVGPAAWPAIVAEDDWRDLCAVLDARRSGPQRPVVSWLTGTARCGVCGTALTTRYCRGVRRYGCPPATSGGCGGVARSATRVEDLIDELVRARLAQVDLRAVETDRGEQQRLEQEQAERDRLFLLDLATRWGQGLLSAEEYDAARAPVDARRKTATAALAPRELRGDDPVAGWERATPEQRKRLARALFDSIIIDRVPSRAERRVFDPDLIRVVWR
jgi:hypothetical protein